MTAFAPLPSLHLRAAGSSHATAIRSAHSPTWRKRSAPSCCGRAAILDGEIVCLDAQGKPQFYDLLRRSEPTYFYAFDLLALDGEDLRTLPLIERKRRLSRIMPKKRARRLLYVGHIAGRGIDLYRAACERDLEGIVAKLARAPYVVCEPRHSTWLKIKNPSYSQMEGRLELFERRARAANG
jgi:bifunctional non-homologous end joining protein LigD